MVDARGIIGNYIVERELGRGGMGVVYAAKHRVLGRPAAIKLLLASTAEERGRVERFFNEARAAMAIDHPGVVKIYDVGISADDRPYIAMELLDGTALAHHIQPAGLPIRQAIDYACQIASALAAAHDAGVIHRDLKPENIIISRDRSRAIVVDFGIAKLAHQATVRTATGALVGTPLYMSPEQCEGLRDLDARSDLYAFGCVIFAMLTGRPPFFEGGTGGLIGMHLHVAPPPLRSRCANASEALERVVSVLLAKSPDARFRTARATLAALQAPEVRGLAAAPGVAATAEAPGARSVQPWAATPAIAIARDAHTMATGAEMAQPVGGSMPPGTAFGVPPSRDAWTQVTGVDMRDPRTAHVQAVGTPSPSSSIVTPHPSSSVHAIAPAHSAQPQLQAQPQMQMQPPSQSRRKLVIAIVASCALTAMIAIGATRGCGGNVGSIDAGVATGAGSGSDVVAIAGSGSNGSGANGGAGSNIAAGIDAGVPIDAAVIATNDREPRTAGKGTTQPKGTSQPKGTTPPKGTSQPKTTSAKRTPPTGSVQIDPNGPPLQGERPRNEVPGSGVASDPDPPAWDPNKPEPERREIHDHMTFSKGDYQATLGQRALDRVAQYHRQDPTRRIIITGFAESDEPTVLATLAENRAKTAFNELVKRGVSKSVLVMNSTAMIQGTRNGENRRVNFDFE